MITEPNCIHSSSVSVNISNRHWFRTTNGDNIMWIAMVSNYDYSYRAKEQQWWCADGDEKSKISQEPEVETIYREMKKT